MYRHPRNDIFGRDERWRWHDLKPEGRFAFNTRTYAYLFLLLIGLVAFVVWYFINLDRFTGRW